MSPTRKTSRLKPALAALGYAVGIALYFLVLHLAVPLWLGAEALKGRELLLLAGIPPVFLALRSSSRWGRLAFFALVMLFFSLALGYYWTSGLTTQGILGGLLPIHDFFHYYTQARNLVDGGLIAGNAGWRPIFSSSLSFILAITNRNLQLSMAVLILMVAISVYFAVLELRRTHGAGAATLFFFLLFFFARIFFDALGTELLGLVFACLAFAFLWRGASTLKKWQVLVGLFFLTIALNIRPAAYFVLPVLMLWMGWLFRGKRKFHFGWAAIAIAPILAAFLLNSAVQKLYTAPGTPSFFNYGYSLYGQVSGGAGINQFNRDYPGVTDAGEIMRLVWERFKAYPLSLAIGTVKSYYDFFRPWVKGDFSFFAHTGRSSYRVIWWFIMNALLVAGVYTSIKKYREPLNSFFLACLFGVLISLPFVPPIDSVYGEKYTATIPLFAVSAPLGLAYLLRKIKGYQKVDTGGLEESSFLPAGITSALITLLVFVAPLGVLLFAKPSDLVPVTCPAGQIPFAVRLDEGTYFILDPDYAVNCAGLPNLCLQRYTENSLPRGIVEIHDFSLDLLERTGKPTLFTETNDVLTYKTFYLGVETDLLPSLKKTGDIYQGCMTSIGPASGHTVNYVGQEQ